MQSVAPNFLAKRFGHQMNAQYSDLNRTFGCYCQFVRISYVALVVFQKCRSTFSQFVVLLVQALTVPCNIYCIRQVIYIYITNCQVIYFLPKKNLDKFCASTWQTPKKGTEFKCPFMPQRSQPYPQRVCSLESQSRRFRLRQRSCSRAPLRVRRLRRPRPHNGCPA